MLCTLHLCYTKLVIRIRQDPRYSRGSTTPPLFAFRPYARDAAACGSCLYQCLALANLGRVQLPCSSRCGGTYHAHTPH